MQSALPSTHSRLRILSERCIFVLVAGLAFRTWYIEGLIIPFEVTGGSMAETLLGRHRDMACADCGHRFVCGTDADCQPVRREAICPLCGCATDGLDRQPDLAGDRLLIHKTIFRFRSPRRWEVVSFRHPGRASQQMAKRVVGLPGESIQIRHGDVYVDGHIKRKRLWEQRALAVLIHDASYQPTLEPAPRRRWRAEGEDSRWGSYGGRFGHPWVTEKEPSDDWLVYHHWRRVAGQPGEIEPCPITDLCGYNQTRPRREEDTHPVTDLMLSLRLIETNGQGRLAIRASDGRNEFEVRVSPRRNRYEVLQNGRDVPGAAGRSRLLTDGVMLEVSLFDQQLLLAFDGQTVVTWPYDPSNRPLKPTPRPLAIGSLGGLGVAISDVRVYRDVYYTHPVGVRGRWGLDKPVRLADDEYFVLGDNSPISSDSRNWPGGPAVPAKLLIGKPLLVHFPAKRITFGRWVFQVPDLTKIRYIR